MPNYLSRMKPNGANGTEYKLKDEELREAFDVFKEDVKGTQTATGNPITLTDASETYAQGLSVELEPKQDLHGYDFPWVGGAGKNKLPLDLATIKSLNTSGTWSGNSYTIYNFTYTVLTDNGGNVTGITGSGTPNGNNANLRLYINLTVSENMIISGTPNVSSTDYLIEAYNASGPAWYSDATPSDGANIPPCTLDHIQISARMGKTLSFTVLPMICSATDQNPTVFEKWSNICPITGYTECEVDDVGKNKFDEANYYDLYTNYDYVANTYRCKRIQLKPNTTYIITQRATVTSTVILLLNSDYYVNGTGFFDCRKAGDSKTYTTGEDGYLYIGTLGNDADTNARLKECKIQIEKGTTATPYEPFKSRTASITFGQTVYGGSVDFLTGKVLVNTAKDILKNLTKNNFTNGVYSTCYRAALSSASTAVQASQTHGAISSYLTENNAYWGTSRTGEEGSGTYAPFFAINTPGEIVAVYDKSTSISESDFLSKYGDMEICYPLANPFTIQLTPTDLKLLQDTNNLTTNGTTITLDYIPNNSIGDAVKASDEYTDRAVERVAVDPKATLIDTWMISEESDTISVDLTSYDCNFFLLEYLFQSKRGTTLIPRPQGGSFSASVVTYNNGTPYYIELDYNPTTKELVYTSNVTSQFGILAIYTI